MSPERVSVKYLRCLGAWDTSCRHKAKDANHQSPKGEWRRKKQCLTIFLQS